MIAKSSPGGQDWRARTTISIPEAGEILGLCRQSAYEAARRGDIPCLRIGTKALRVPTAALQTLARQCRQARERGGAVMTRKSGVYETVFQVGNSHKCHMALDLGTGAITPIGPPRFRHR